MEHRIPDLEGRDLRVPGFVRPESLEWRISELRVDIEARVSDLTGYLEHRISEVGGNIESRMP